MKRKSSKLYVGMDVHKESIDLSLAEEGGEVRHHGRIGGDMNALWRALRKLESSGRELVFVYEAGPCGFGIYRNLTARGHACWVVAPSNTPRRVRDRIKTDRRDSVKLAGLARAGELTPISRESAFAYFDQMIANVRDPYGYAAWMVPVVSARVSGAS